MNAEIMIVITSQMEGFTKFNMGFGPFENKSG
jgi:hypothetical protein